MSYDPLLRRPMLLWMAGLSAALPDLCLRGAPSGASAQLCCLLSFTFRRLQSAPGLPKQKSGGNCARLWLPSR